MKVVSFEGGGGGDNEGHELSVKERLVRMEIDLIIRKILNEYTGSRELPESVIGINDCKFEVKQDNPDSDIKIIVEFPNPHQENKRFKPRVSREFLVERGKIITDDEEFTLTPFQIAALQSIVKKQNESGDKPED